MIGTVSNSEKVSKKIGVFLIHGLLGSPDEFKALERKLVDEGYFPYSITLPGHGMNSTIKLNELTAESLMAHCQNEYDIFCENYDETVVIGHSLGGLCALLLGSGEYRREMKGIMTIAAPFEHSYLINFPQGLFNIPLTQLIEGLVYLPEVNTGFYRPEFKFQWYPHINQQGNLLISQLKKQLPKVRIPLWLTHSLYDLIVPYYEMEKISSYVKNPMLVSQFTLEQCGHQIFPFSRESQRVEQLIFRFLRFTQNRSQTFEPLQGRIGSTLIRTGTGLL